LLRHAVAGTPWSPSCSWNERLGFDPDVIGAQLAHLVRASFGCADNRTDFVEQRRKMLQAWSDYLDRLRRGAPVVSIGRYKQ
jgi:hypothetical protein